MVIIFLTGDDLTTRARPPPAVGVGLPSSNTGLRTFLWNVGDRPSPTPPSTTNTKLTLLVYYRTEVGIRTVQHVDMIGTKF